VLYNGELTIVFEFEIYPHEAKGQSLSSRSLRLLDTSPTLEDNIAKYFGNEKLSDVTVICGSQSFRCHKLILAAQSDVFAAMFEHENTIESKWSTVKVEDIDAETFEKLLNFIYTEKTSSLGDIVAKNSLAMNLLSAADKYNIQRLKAVCEEVIGSTIEVSTAAEVVLLAYLHEATTLKTVATNFVARNYAKVKETAAWQDIIESHPKIMAEVLAVMMEKLNV